MVTGQCRSPTKKETFITAWNSLNITILGYNLSIIIGIFIEFEKKNTFKEAGTHYKKSI